MATAETQEAAKPLNPLVNGAMDYIRRAGPVTPETREWCASPHKEITEDMLPKPVVPQRILDDPKAYRVWKRNVLRGGCASTNLRFTVQRKRPGLDGIPFAWGSLEQINKDIAEMEAEQARTADAGYPFYDPEYLVTPMYARKRGLLVSTPDRGEQCIYWAGQEMPGGSGDLEKVERSLFGACKTFPGLLFVTVPPEYGALCKDNSPHEASALPADAGTRTEPQSFFGFYFARAMDRQGEKYEYKPVSKERLSLLYTEHRGRWINIQKIPESNLEAVADGAAWLPIYPPHDVAELRKKEQEGRDKGREKINEVKKEESKETEEEARAAAASGVVVKTEVRVIFFSWKKFGDPHPRPRIFRTGGRDGGGFVTFLGSNRVGGGRSPLSHPHLPHWVSFWSGRVSHVPFPQWNIFEDRESKNAALMAEANNPAAAVDELADLADDTQIDSLTAELRNRTAQPPAPKPAAAPAKANVPAPAKPGATTPAIKAPAATTPAKVTPAPGKPTLPPKAPAAPTVAAPAAKATTPATKATAPAAPGKTAPAAPAAKTAPAAPATKTTTPAAPAKAPVQTLKAPVAPKAPIAPKKEAPKIEVEEEPGEEGEEEEPEAPEGEEMEAEPTPPPKAQAPPKPRPAPPAPAAKAPAAPKPKAAPPKPAPVAPAPPVVGQKRKTAPEPAEEEQLFDAEMMSELADTPGVGALDDDMETDEGSKAKSGGSKKSSGGSSSNKKAKKSGAASSAHDGGEEEDVGTGAANGKSKPGAAQALQKQEREKRATRIKAVLVAVATKRAKELADMDESTRAAALEKATPLYVEHVDEEDPRKSLGSCAEMIRTWVRYAMYYGAIDELKKQKTHWGDPMEGMTYDEAMTDPVKKKELQQFLHVTYYALPEGCPGLPHHSERQGAEQDDMSL